MKARYQSLLSRIHAEWSEEDWLKFRDAARVPNLLTTMYEAAHWFQRQTLLERALHLVTVRCLCELAGPRTPAEQDQLRKVVLCRRLLAPISEGLALYTQFDYFPSNFFIGAGERSPYDALVEFLVARRNFEMPPEAGFNLGHEAWHALVDARMSQAAVMKKRQLLETPFHILDSRISGYLIIKAAIADARSKGPFYMHDGHLVPLIMSMFYGCPELISAVLSREVTAAQLVEIATSAVAERIGLLLDGHTLGNMFLETRRRVPDMEHTVWLERDIEGYSTAQELYRHAFNASMVPIRSSLGEWIRPEQSIDQYLEDTYSGEDGDAPYPLDIVNLLSSPHFGRLFTTEVTLQPGDNSLDVSFEAGGKSLHIRSTSDRARAYRWLRPSKAGEKGRLTEAIVHLHGLRHDFFHASFISHEKGLSVLTHNTNDYNVGYFYLGDYLGHAYRVDQCLERIDRDLVAFEKADGWIKETGEVAKTKAHRAGVESAIEPLFSDRSASTRTAWICGRDVFKSEDDFVAFVAFSLAVRLGEFAFESKAIVRDNLKTNLGHLGLSDADFQRAAKFLSRREPVCRVRMKGSWIDWPSFSCLL